MTPSVRKPVAMSAQETAFIIKPVIGGKQSLSPAAVHSPSARRSDHVGGDGALEAGSAWVGLIIAHNTGLMKTDIIPNRQKNKNLKETQASWPAVRADPCSLRPTVRAGP